RLFKAVLETLGFKVEGLAARVRWRLPAEAPLPPRAHMLLQVSVGGELWLADDGFGGLSQAAPIRIGTDPVQATWPWPFTVRQRIECHYLLEALVGGEWQSLSEFDTRPQLPVDYELSNWYISTHPEARFVNHLIAALPAPDGRHTL